VSHSFYYIQKTPFVKGHFPQMPAAVCKPFSVFGSLKTANNGQIARKNGIVRAL
jgi:hypothetical protein